MLTTKNLTPTFSTRTMTSRANRNKERNFNKRTLFRHIKLHPISQLSHFRFGIFANVIKSEVEAYNAKGFAMIYIV